MNDLLGGIGQSGNDFNKPPLGGVNNRDDHMSFDSVFDSIAEYYNEEINLKLDPKVKKKFTESIESHLTKTSDAALERHAVDHNAIPYFDLINGIQKVDVADLAGQLPTVNGDKSLYDVALGSDDPAVFFENLIDKAL